MDPVQLFAALATSPSFHRALRSYLQLGQAPVEFTPVPESQAPLTPSLAFSERGKPAAVTWQQCAEAAACWALP